MDLAKRITESDQQRYFEGHVTPWLTFNPTELLMTVESLPTKSAQEAVANELLRLHQYFGNGLSEEQVGFVQSFLAESTTSNTSAE